MSKITESARGEVCQLRLDSCNSGIDGEKVVFCHADGGGMGLKSKDDLGRDIGWYGCSSCHDYADGRTSHPYYTHKFIQERVQYAIADTERLLKKKGLK